MQQPDIFAKKLTLIEFQTWGFELAYFPGQSHAHSKIRKKFVETVQFKNKMKLCIRKEYFLK